MGKPERVGAQLWREVLAGVDLDTLALYSTNVKFHAHGTGGPRQTGAKRSAVHWAS